MIRVVLAVCLTVALVGYTIPAIETAREHRSGSIARDELESLDATATRLAARNEPTAPETPGAAQVVTVRVPEGVTLVVGDGPSGGSLAWVRDGRRHRVNADLAFVGPIELGTGSHRLHLALVRVEGDVAIDVRRFKSGSGTTRRHVRTRRFGRLSV